MARKKKQEVKRSILIEGLGIELELSIATAVRTDKQMIHLDQLPNGSWRLIYNSNLIPDFTKVQSFKIIREDPAPGDIPDGFKTVTELGKELAQGEEWENALAEARKELSEKLKHL